MTEKSGFGFGVEMGAGVDIVAILVVSMTLNIYGGAVGSLVGAGVI